MGVQSKERVGRVVEGVQILRRLWNEDSVTHHGKYYQFDDVDLVPKPLQQPCPIFIAANPKGDTVDEVLEERILRRVAKHADGWQSDTTTPETFKRRFDTIREYAAQEGKDPSTMESCLHVMVNINEDRDKAYEEATSYMARYYGVGAISRERTELWLAYGSPEEVIAKIRSYTDAGCTMPVMRFVAPDLHGQVDRCIKEVLPAFAK